MTAKINSQKQDQTYCASYLASLHRRHAAQWTISAGSSQSPAALQPGQSAVHSPALEALLNYQCKHILPIINAKSRCSGNAAF